MYFFVEFTKKLKEVSKFGVLIKKNNSKKVVMFT